LFFFSFVFVVEKSSKIEHLAHTDALSKFINPSLFLISLLLGRAAVVAAAVSRIRMVFDEILGSDEASHFNNSPSREHMTAPPPSPESNHSMFRMSPPKLVVPNSSSSTSASTGVCFTFPSATQEGRFGKIPMRSPPSPLPWQPNTSLGDGYVKIEIPSLDSSSHHFMKAGDNNRNDTRSPSSMNRVKIQFRFLLLAIILFRIPQEGLHSKSREARQPLSPSKLLTKDFLRYIWDIVKSIFI
jgi:hypothetical protein